MNADDNSAKTPAANPTAPVSSTNPRPADMRFSAPTGGKPERRTLSILIRTLAWMLASTILIAACDRAEEPREAERDLSIAVVSPGSIDTNPELQEVTDGTEEATGQFANVNRTVYELPLDREMWPERLAELSEEAYDLVVVVGSKLAEVADSVSARFVDTRFLVIDGHWEGNDAIHSILVNRREQAFLAGYFAGLLSSYRADDAGTVHVGIVGGRETPVFNQVFLPAARIGARTVEEDAAVPAAFVGDLEDHEHAEVTAGALFDDGASVVLTYAGAADTGVHGAADTFNGKVISFYRSAYDDAVGTVVGVVHARLQEITAERVNRFIEGKLAFGTNETVGVADNAVAFDFEHRSFTDHVPEAVRAEIQSMFRRLSDGEITLEMPTTLPE